METKAINKEVNVTAWYFSSRRKRLLSYPKRIEYNDQEYTFADGLRLLVQKGKQAVQLFDMTDGVSDFRLQLDAEQSWTLLSISQARTA